MSDQEDDTETFQLDNRKLFPIYSAMFHELNAVSPVERALCIAAVVYLFAGDDYESLLGLVSEMVSQFAGMTRHDYGTRL